MDIWVRDVKGAEGSSFAKQKAGANAEPEAARPEHQRGTPPNLFLKNRPAIT